MRRRWQYCWLRDPNKDDTGDQTDQTWPEYTNDGRQVIVLDTGRELQTQTGLRDRYCQFWSESVPRLVAATEGTHFSPCVIVSLIQNASSSQSNYSSRIVFYYVPILLGPTGYRKHDIGNMKWIGRSVSDMAIWFFFQMRGRSVVPHFSRERERPPLFYWNQYKKAHNFIWLLTGTSLCL